MGLLGVAGGGVALSLILALALGVLNTAAVYRIITKAGFSGAWILAPLSVVALWIITLGVTIDAATSLSKTTLGAAGALLVLDYLDLFFNWILFLVFAFADWPALQSSGRRQGPAIWQQQPAPLWQPPPVEATPEPVEATPEPVGAPTAPQAAKPAHRTRRPEPAVQAQPTVPVPGWYPVEGTTDDQLYWSGRAWTARRQRREDTWKDVPLNFLSPAPPDPAHRVED